MTASPRLPDPTRDGLPLVDLHRHLEGSVRPATVGADRATPYALRHSFASLLAHEHGCHVTSVDLTEEFCATARWLDDAVGLTDRIHVQHGDVTALPFGAERAESSHLVAPEALRDTLATAGFTPEAWNDLTGPTVQAMRPFLARPPAPLGLHVFVPDFAAKARNLLGNAEHDRVRLIQAVLTTDERAGGPPRGT